MSEIFDKPREECGVFGILAESYDTIPALDAYNALYALQHRGQHSAGIAVSDGEEIRYKKGDGLVPDVFSEKDLPQLPGRMALGHVRYAAKGGTSGVNAQPIVVKTGGEHIALAFNGSLTNAARLRDETEKRGGIFQTTGDAEIMLHVIVREMLAAKDIEKAVLNAMDILVGAYSLIIMTRDKLIAARDPQGFRPLCMGRIGESVVFASESCALDAVDADFVRDIAPGEVVSAERGGPVRSAVSEVKARQSLCCFEYVYFARPDSVIDGVSVELARQEAGRCLARSERLDADVVIGVPDSGLSAALGYSLGSGIPYSVGFVKNRYIGRTFIQSSRGQRERSLKIKLNALSAVVSGKRVVMVDDSIVRGTTCARTISILREAGAREVHMRVSSPPFLYPCYFGTDIPSRDSLVAVNHTVGEIAGMIGVDSLRFLAIEDIAVMLKDLSVGFCDACFTGRYSVPAPESGR